MRLVKLTRSSHPDDDWFVNPEHVVSIDVESGETVIRLLAIDSDADGHPFNPWFVVQGTPAEVARLLAGEGGETIERPYLMELANLLVGPLTKDDFFTGPDLISEVKSRAAKEQALAAEVERLKALNAALHDKSYEEEIAALKAREKELIVTSGDTVAALKRERDEARALLETALRALVLTHQYAPETLPPIAGWEWFDAAVALAGALPGSEWAGQVPAERTEDEQPDPDEPKAFTSDPRGEWRGEGSGQVLWWVWTDGREVSDQALRGWCANNMDEPWRYVGAVVRKAHTDAWAAAHPITDPEPADPGTDGEQSRDDPAQPPAPATPTTARGMLAPTSTSGITVMSGTGSFLPLTRKSDGFYLRGCSYVLFMPSDGELSIIGDSYATDGQAPGTIRWRVNNGGNPFDDDRASSPKAVLLKADTVVSGAPTWPAASAPISVADLGPPLTDADGSKWWRVEAWSDVSATANKSEATDRATVFFVCVLAPGATAPRPPAVGYHASDPIVTGSPVVHPIVFTTDNDPSPGAGESPEPLLFRDDAHLQKILDNADPGVKATALGLHRDGFQSKRSGTYFVDRTAGHWLSLRPPRARGFDFGPLCTAIRLLTGEATDEDKTFLRLYALNNALSAPEIAIGEHGDTTALWGGFSYYAFREVACIAFVYSWGRKHNLWTPSEEARIRDQLARFVWVSLQLHRNPYKPWINANGSTQAMWESARDWVSGLVALVMPGYFSEQYGQSIDWRSFFVKGTSYFSALNSRSGLFGLLSSEPRWNDDGGRYFTSHNCAGPLALTLACLANAGEAIPDYYEDALILALDGKLPGAEGVRFWSPFLVNDNFPLYMSAVLAKHGKAAVVAAQTHISTGNNDDVPGGLGAGTAVLGLLLTEVV